MALLVTGILAFMVFYIYALWVAIGWIFLQFGVHLPWLIHFAIFMLVTGGIKVSVKK